MVCGQHDGNGYYEVSQLCKATKKYIINSITELNRYLNNKTWYVHESELPLLFKRAKDTGNHSVLDYSQLPNHIQENITSVLNKFKKIVVQPSDDFSVLFLTPSAPSFIIEAVWRAILKKHHPDVGGDADKFLSYKQAYERLRKING